jgi:hypothetical protein
VRPHGALAASASDRPCGAACDDSLAGCGLPTRRAPEHAPPRPRNADRHSGRSDGDLNRCDDGHSASTLDDLGSESSQPQTPSVPRGQAASPPCQFGIQQPIPHVPDAESKRLQSHWTDCARLCLQGTGTRWRLWLVPTARPRQRARVGNQGDQVTCQRDAFGTT